MVEKGSDRSRLLEESEEGGRIVRREGGAKIFDLEGKGVEGREEGWAIIFQDTEPKSRRTCSDTSGVPVARARAREKGFASGEDGGSGGEMGEVADRGDSEVVVFRREFGG